MSEREHEPGESRPRAKTNAKMRANRARLRRQALRRLAKAHRKAKPGVLISAYIDRIRSVLTKLPPGAAVRASQQFATVLRVIARFESNP